MSANPTKKDYDPGSYSPLWVLLFIAAIVALGVSARSCGGAIDSVPPIPDAPPVVDDSKVPPGAWFVVFQKSRGTYDVSQYGDADKDLWFNSKTMAVLTAGRLNMGLKNVSANRGTTEDRTAYVYWNQTEAYYRPTYNNDGQSPEFSSWSQAASYANARNRQLDRMTEQFKLLFPGLIRTSHVEYPSAPVSSWSTPTAPSVPYGAFHQPLHALGGTVPVPTLAFGQMFRPARAGNFAPANCGPSG